MYDLSVTGTGTYIKGKICIHYKTDGSLFSASKMQVPVPVPDMGQGRPGKIVLFYRLEYGDKAEEYRKFNSSFVSDSRAAQVRTIYKIQRNQTCVGIITCSFCSFSERYQGQVHKDCQSFGSDPDPVFKVNTGSVPDSVPDSDPALHVNTDPDPGFFMTNI